MKEQETKIDSESTKIKDMPKIILKVFLFCLIGIIIALAITPFFVPKWSDEYGGATRRIKGMYNEPKNTIDVVMLGNSDMYNGISPMYLWKESGITSYHIGAPMQTTWTSYYLLKDFYKTQKPKLVIIDADYIFEEKDRSDPNRRKSFDCMKLSLNKIQAICDPVFKLSIEKKLSYLVPLIRYHSRWNELDSKDIKEAYEVYDAQFKGYELTRGKKAYKKTANKQENDDIEKIPQKSKEYLDKIIKLCNENNTQVLLTYIPTKNWTEKRNSLVTEYAKENNIQFVDCNLMEFDWNQYTRDKGSHLNVYGAEAITKQISEYLKEYNIPNHKEDTKYEKWNKDLEKYEEQKNA